MEPRNRFQRMNSASQSGLAGRYDNPIPTWFLSPIDFLKIPALISFLILVAFLCGGGGGVKRKSVFSGNF